MINSQVSRLPVPVFNVPAPVVTKLGEGTGGVVELITDALTGSPAARKRFKHRCTADVELNCLIELAPNTPHMVEFRGAYEILNPKAPEKPTACIEMNYIRAQNIYEAYLRPGCPRLQIEEIKSIGCQLFEFLAAAQSKNYIHGDLKPENLIWQALLRALTVIDFGSAHKIGSSHADRTQATCAYAPPELILNKERTSSYDLWSAGCILFELITGEPFCYLVEGLSSTHSYQYALQQIVSQIGPPGLSYIIDCEAFELSFDNDMNLRNGWNIDNRPFWEHAVKQSLAARNVSQAEIDQWIGLLRRLLSYENRGSAPEHLANPLFNSEATVHLLYMKETAYRCKVFIARAGLLTPEAAPAIEDIARMDVSIDLKVHKDLRCIHIPLDPNDRYFVFLDNDQDQIVAPFSLNGSHYLNIVQIQQLLYASSGNAVESPAKKGKTESTPVEELVQDEAPRLPACRARTF
jgi:serine/threonine protein kinase